MLDTKVKNGFWDKVPSRSLTECTLGVIGVGAIGKAVLRRARAFGMKSLIGYDLFDVEPGKKQQNLFFVFFRVLL